MSQLTVRELLESGFVYRMADNVRAACNRLKDGETQEFGFTPDDTVKIIDARSDVKDLQEMIASDSLTADERSDALLALEASEKTLYALLRSERNQQANDLQESLRKFRAGWSFVVSVPKAKGAPEMVILVKATQDKPIEARKAALLARFRDKRAGAKDTITRKADGTETRNAPIAPSAPSAPTATPAKS